MLANLLKRVSSLFAMAVIPLAVSFAASSGADLHSAADLQALSHKLAAKGTGFVELDHYGNHYTMLAYRSKTGSAEIHEREADIFMIVSGKPGILLGGKVMGAKTEKPGEIRGTSIQGGERRQLGPGDVIHISANEPHQLLVSPNDPVTYFVVKVTGQ